MIIKLASALNMRSLPSLRLVVLKQIKQNRQHISNYSKHLLVDVSAIIREDEHTGIQRVVRALLLQLFSNPPEGYKVLPIFCTRTHGYRYADSLFVHKFTSYNDELLTGNVIVGSGDIFFGLDLCAHLLPYHENELLEWKQQGVKIHILVYDMLPYHHSEWFTHRAVKNFRQWLRTISIYSDHLICISDSVKNELRNWIMSEGFSAHTPRIATIPLGSEIASSLPSNGTDTITTKLIEKLKTQKFILMVGTVEPRKGYADALDAMEYLWNNGNEISLVIVGKMGWKTIKLQERLLSHEQVGKKFFWLKNISDQNLQKLYKMANSVLVASYGEGFGLPLVEAMYYGKSLLVRDIPVFREVTKNYQNVDFFDTKENILVDKISYLSHKELRSCDVMIHIPTWHESVLVLNAIFLSTQRKSSLNGN
jgi:glycosyltransferase involved in cell wall biosynthesis